MLGKEGYCIFCGKDLSNIPWARNFCDNNCSVHFEEVEIIEDLITNQKYINVDWYWGWIRGKVLTRDKNICQNCGIKEEIINGKYNTTMEVHHIIPRHKGGGSCLENLITLCTTCHKKTFKRKYYRSVSVKPEMSNLEAFL